MSETNGLEMKVVRKSAAAVNREGFCSAKT